MLGYIDAASGGMIVAAVAGGVAGLRVAVKSLVPGRRRRESSERNENEVASSNDAVAEATTSPPEAGTTDPR